MIMIPAFMQQQLLEQGGVGPEPLYSPAPSSLAASTLILSGVKSSQTAQSAEQSADMTADAIAMKRGNKNKRKRWDSKKIQKKPARVKGRRPWGRPAAVIASRGMPASDREELNTFLQKHSLHASAIQIDLPTKVPRWGSAELFEGEFCSVLWCVAPVSQAGVHSPTQCLKCFRITLSFKKIQRRMYICPGPFHPLNLLLVLQMY